MVVGRRVDGTYVDVCFDEAAGGACCDEDGVEDFASTFFGWGGFG
jgi:hypothetical protein